MCLRSIILKQCFANPETSSKLVRYPVVAQQNLRYTHVCVNLVTIVEIMIDISVCNSEMYHAKRWHTDFPAAIMTVINSSHIFVNDFVNFNHQRTGETLGKVLRLLQKV